MATLYLVVNKKVVAHRHYPSCTVHDAQTHWCLRMTRLCSWWPVCHVQYLWTPIHDTVILQNNAGWKNDVAVAWAQNPTEPRCTNSQIMAWSVAILKSLTLAWAVWVVNRAPCTLRGQDMAKISAIHFFSMQQRWIKTIAIPFIPDIYETSSKWGIKRRSRSSTSSPQFKQST